MSSLETFTPQHPMTALEPILTRMELPKTARNIRNRVIRNRPLPLYQGFAEGERFKSNGPVLLFDHIEEWFAYSDTGAHRLPVDEPVGGGKGVTLTDQYSDLRRGLLIELIATHLGANQVFFPLTPIVVYHIKGEWDKVPPIPVTATYLLRLLVGNGAAKPQARMITKNALNRIVWGAKETIAAAATRLLDAFRASAAIKWLSPPRYRKIVLLAVYFGGGSCGCQAEVQYDVDA